MNRKGIVIIVGVAAVAAATRFRVPTRRMPDRFTR